MRFHSYLKTASAILEEYKGERPFPSFAKEFFSRDKKYGATDRKIISHLCYCYFRLGKADLQLDANERILLALFLCSGQSHPVLKALRPEWDKATNIPIEEKISMAYSGFDVLTIFPWRNQMSEGMDPLPFCLSFLRRPKFFIRIRPGYENIVPGKLDSVGISFERINAEALALPQGSKIESVLQLNREAVVQDLSSQRVGGLFPPLQPGQGFWDCCAGSGGKSILAFDRQPLLNITVSDKRESILANLKSRFTEAGIRPQKLFLADLEKETVEHLRKKIGEGITFILADVPCSGSGTWARNPEQLYFFDPIRIKYFQDLQQRILCKLAPLLKRGDQFLYITCSVFEMENEANGSLLEREFGLMRLNKQLIRGYSESADTLFGSLFTLL